MLGKRRKSGFLLAEVLIGIFLLLLGLTSCLLLATITTRNIVRTREEVLARSVIRSMEECNWKSSNDTVPGWTIVPPLNLNGETVHQAIFKTTTNREFVITWANKQGTSGNPDNVPRIGDKVVSWMGNVYDVSEDGIMPRVAEIDMRADLLLVRQPVEIKVEMARGIPHVWK